jgi:hypothetical protein
MLARKELVTTDGGAFAPEGCLDPETFMAHMRARGSEAYEDLAMTKPLGK